MHESAKILIVEDEKNIRLFLQELLTQEGYLVTAVTDGEAALANLNDKNIYDLVLLDLKLGQGISGIDLLQSIRQQTADTTVIILTAHGSLETAIEALRLGAHDYLLKPSKAEAIRLSVRQGLQKQQHNIQQHQALNQLEEVLASTLANIRASTTPTVTAPDNTADRFVRRGNIIIDQVRHTTTYSGHLLELSPIQYELLLYMVKAAPRIVTTQELAQNVCNYELDEWESSNVIRPVVRRLPAAV